MLVSHQKRANYGKNVILNDTVIQRRVEYRVMGEGCGAVIFKTLVNSRYSFSKS